MRLWPWTRALAYVIVTAALVGGSTAAFGLLSLHLRSLFTPLCAATIREASACAVALAVALLARRFVDRRSLGSLGFPFGTNWIGLMALGFGLGAGMQCLICALQLGLGFSRLTGHLHPGGALTAIVVALPLFVVGALGEEVAVRGYVLQNLWEQWGFVPATILSAALFAALHLGNPNSQAQVALTLAGLLAYGVWACLSILWTKSLWLAFGCHFGWNLFEGPILGFPVSGLNVVPLSVVGQHVAGPRWFTGGEFGPEAGLVSIISLAVGVIVLYALQRAGAFADVPDTREAYARSVALPR